MMRSHGTVTHDPMPERVRFDAMHACLEEIAHRTVPSQERNPALIPQVPTLVLHAVALKTELTEMQGQVKCQLRKVLCMGVAGGTQAGTRASSGRTAS